MSDVKSAYEAVVVFSVKNGDESAANMVTKFKEFIEKNAILDNMDEWGKRKLAYMINKEPDGYYVLFNFTCDANFPAELDRVLRITDEVLRSLIVKKS